MDTQNFSEDVLFINLPEYPQHGDEIDTINKMLSNSVNRDVVIDFSKVKMLTSENICGLMILDKLLRGSGHYLILCYVSSIIRQIFVRTGLVAVFNFADNEHEAIRHIQSRNMSMAEF
jgi:anti-anti-sigma regulatory factor